MVSLWQLQGYLKDEMQRKRLAARLSAIATALTKGEGDDEEKAKATTDEDEAAAKKAKASEEDDTAEARRAKAEEEDEAAAKKAKAEQHDEVDPSSKAYQGLFALAKSQGCEAEFVNAVMAGFTMTQLRAFVIDAKASSTQDIAPSAQINGQKQISSALNQGTPLNKNSRDVDSLYASYGSTERKF